MDEHDSNPIYPNLIFLLGIVIDFEGFVTVLKYFNYISNHEDKNEMRVWFFNKDLFANAPKYF